MGTTAYMDTIPPCDMPGCESTAYADARTSSGRWGYMCRMHFDQEGCRLGTGFGQQLRLNADRNFNCETCGEPAEADTRMSGDENGGPRCRRHFDEEHRALVRDALARGDFAEVEDLVGDGDIAEFI